MSAKFHIIYFIIILCLIALLLHHPKSVEQSSVSSAEYNHSSEEFVTATSDKAFLDAAEDAAFAISERNFRITNTLRIGNAIRERGTEAYPENDVILFCNIRYAELMLDLEPEYVNYCPGQITVREAANNQVIISAPLVPKHPTNTELNELVDEVNQLITESVEFAAQTWQEETE